MMPGSPYLLRSKFSSVQWDSWQPGDSCMQQEGHPGWLGGAWWKEGGKNKASPCSKNYFLFPPDWHHANLGDLPAPQRRPQVPGVHTVEKVAFWVLPPSARFQDGGAFKVQNTFTGIKMVVPEKKVWALPRRSWPHFENHYSGGWREGEIRSPLCFLWILIRHPHSQQADPTFRTLGKDRSRQWLETYQNVSSSSSTKSAATFYTEILQEWFILHILNFYLL